MVGSFIKENINIKAKFNVCVKKIHPFDFGMFLNSENSFTNGAIKNFNM